MKQKGIILAILTMSVIQMGTTAITPVLSDIAQNFPELDPSEVQLLMTFPSLFVIVITLLAASLSRVIPKKYIAAMGCTLFSVSGILSWLCHDSIFFLFLLAAVMGIGIGLAVPMATSLVTDYFSGEEQQRVMGWQSSAANVGAMLMTLAGGYLALLHWSLNYLVYLIAVPGIIFSLICLPKQNRQSLNGETLHQSTSTDLWHIICNKTVVWCCGISFVATMCFNTTPTNLSMYIAEHNVGNAAQAGVATTIMLFGGTVMGMLFGKITARIGKNVMVLGFGMLALGQLLISQSSAMWMVYLGSVLCGFTMSCVMPRVMLDSAIATQNGAATTALCLSANNLGGFCAPVVTRFAALLFGSDAVMLRYIVSAAIAFLMAFILLFVNKKKSKIM